MIFYYISMTTRSLLREVDVFLYKEMQRRLDEYYKTNNKFINSLREASDNLYNNAKEILSILNGLYKGNEDAIRKDKEYLDSNPTYVVCKTEKFPLKDRLGIKASEIVITYKTIRRKHFIKGLTNNESNHVYTEDFLKHLGSQLLKPILVRKYSAINREDGLTFYLHLKINGDWTRVGIELDTTNGRIETLFGDNLLDREQKDVVLENVLYVNEDSPDIDQFLPLIKIDENTPQDVKKAVDEFIKK